MKKKLTYLVLAFAVVLLPPDVFAKVNSVLTTDEDVSKGEKLNVSIRIEADSTNDEYDVYRAIIDYDENLFSGIDEKSFKTYSGWGDLQYNKDTHSIILINKYGSSMSENVISFNLILKDNANPSETKVRLTNQVISNLVGDYSIADVENDVDVNIHMMDLGITKNNPVVYGSPLVENPVKIYHVLTLIVLELVIAIILVMIYRAVQGKIANKKMRMGFIGTLAVVELFALSAVFTYNIARGDLNGDKVMNNEDINILAKHLVNSEMLSPFQLENADMNKDGRITPADLSILVGKCTSKSVYEAKLTNAVMENNGYEKGSEIDLRFLADVTNDEEVEYVIIDGTKHKVEKVEGNEYAIKLAASNVSKKYNYNITEVVLKNGKTAKVDYGTTVVVLKDMPVLSAFSTKEDLANSSVKVALTLTDDDNAVVNAKYELVDSKGSIVSSGRLDKGKNSLNLKLDNAIAYKLKIKIDYNRGADSGEYYGTIEDSYDLKIITDYRFKMGNLNLSQNNVNTAYLEKGIDTYLTFTSSNVSGYAPRKIVINGQQYSVSSAGKGVYRVKLNNAYLENGSEINVTKVTLSNGKVILVNERMNYTVLKERPSVFGVTTSESIPDASLNVGFIVTDKDNTISKLVVKLFDEGNHLVSEQEVIGNNYNVILPTAMTSKYIVRIYANYSRAATHNHTDELVYEGSVDALMRAQVNEYKVGDVYPEKNSVMNLNFNITSNYRTNVKQVIIDNVIYDVLKTGVNAYRVEVNVGEDAGIKNYNLKKIIFENGMTYDVDNTVTIDVQKDYPVLENYTVEENVKDGIIDVAFDLFDVDGAFRSGEISLIDKTTREVVASKNVILGKNKATFTLENAVKYDIEINVNGILDTEVLSEESPNKFEGYNLFRNEYRIVTDYKLEVDSIETASGGIVTDQFGANGEVEVSFASTNVTEYVPIRVKINGTYYDLEAQDGRYKFVMPGFVDSGSVTLKFESVVLSNHKELAVNAFKRIEILKAIPVLERVEITNGEDGQVAVSTLIDDRDSALFDLRAMVTDALGNELYNGPITDGAFAFAKGENTKYTLKIFGSYDLNNDTDIMEENRYLDQVLFESLVDESDLGFEMSKVENSVLIKKDTDELIEQVTSSLLDDLDKLQIKLVLSEEEEKVYDVYGYEVDGQTVTFIIKSEEWVTTADGKRANFMKVSFELAEENIGN